VMLRAGEIFADGDKRTLLNSDNLTQLYETPLTLAEHNGFYQVFPGTANSTHEF
jgi:iron complex transport system ATP-binding protein